MTKRTGTVFGRKDEENKKIVHRIGTLRTLAYTLGLRRDTVKSTHFAHNVCFNYSKLRPSLGSISEAQTLVRRARMLQ